MEKLPMTKIKFCGLSCFQDIEIANTLLPDYIGFVFVPQSRRYVTPEMAKKLKVRLNPRIQAAGVFLNEKPEIMAELANQNIIHMIQLHGQETEQTIKALRSLTSAPIIQAFTIQTADDINRAETSSADLILLDSGAGTGTVFDWSLIRCHIKRPFFLAGGLNPANVTVAIQTLSPYGVDVSSGIEINGKKDKHKMAAFTAAVRKEEMQ